MTQKTSGSEAVRGMNYGRSTEFGHGHLSGGMKVCDRCNNSRGSAIHKRKCRVNPTPIWE